MTRAGLSQPRTWLVPLVTLVGASVVSGVLLRDQSFAVRYFSVLALGIGAFAWGYLRHDGSAAWPPLTHLERRQYRETWEALAHTAVQSNDEQLSRSSQAPLQLLEELVRPGPQDKVLEIGCGMGRIGAALAPRVTSWTGADISPTMLARASLRMKGVANAHFHLVDRSGLYGLSDNSFDVVYSINVLPHLEESDRWRYVSEAFRVLRPGGRLLIDGLDLTSDAGWSTFVTNAGHFAEQAEPPYTPRFSTAEELSTYAQRAGFTDIRSHHRSPSVIVTATKPET